MSRDRGSATVWVIACCALVCLVGAVSVTRTLAVLARHRAGTAADLAALAAAGRIGIDGTSCAAASRIARADGARLARCALHLDTDGRSGSVTVTVGVTAHLPLLGTGTVRASARAGRLPAVPAAAGR